MRMGFSDLLVCMNVRTPGLLSGFSLNSILENFKNCLSHFSFG